MIFWLAKSALLSLLLISIIHYLYIFLKNNLTQPKIKDLIHHPKKEYEDILELINKGNSELQSKNNDSESTTKIDDLPGNSKEESYLDNNNMQDELSQFLLEQNDNMITTNNEGEYNNFSFSM